MLKTIGVESLRVGMYLHDLDAPWLQNPFWRTSRLLTNRHDVERVQKSGIRNAIIDLSNGVGISTTAELTTILMTDKPSTDSGACAAEPAHVPLRKPVPIPLDVELARAAQICAHSRRAVIRMFSEARMDAALDADVASVVVDDIAESVARNSSALISLARLKSQDDYTYMHSVSVCALMIALARQLGMDDKAVKLAGYAGLTHDIGKIAVPLDVLNKPGKLTDEEFRSVRGHPEAGRRLLQQADSISDVVLDVCLHHHEKVDGSGYPHGLAGEQISVYARMGAICDVYDAITSNRPYKAGWCPAESLKKMASWTGSHFDPVIFQAFVKAIGICPVGSLVRLKSNQLAVVVDQNEVSLLKPFVLTFFSCTSSAYTAPQLVDLRACDGTDGIVSLESAEQWGLANIHRFWLQDTHR